VTISSIIAGIPIIESGRDRVTTTRKSGSSKVLVPIVTIVSDSVTSGDNHRIAGQPTSCVMIPSRSSAVVTATDAVAEAVLLLSLLMSRGKAFL
jgi:hypothetical protein